MSSNLFPIAQALPPFAALADAKHSLAHYRSHYHLQSLLNSGARHVAGHVLSCGISLALQAWLVDEQRPTALCVHGYFDHSGWSGPLIAFLLARGFNVCCLDLPGHGLSNGERAAITNFDDYGVALRDALIAIEQVLPSVCLAVGHSTGAAAWLNCLAVNRARDCQLILLAPLLRPTHWQGYGRFIYGALKPFVRHYPRKKRASSSNIHFNRAFEADPLVPNYLTLAWVGAMQRWLTDFAELSPLPQRSLLIQGQRDHTVDWRYNIPQLQQKLPNSELHYIAEGRHQLINESAAIQQKWQAMVVDFLKQQ